jgi:hypothetical protein
MKTFRICTILFATMTASGLLAFAADKQADQSSGKNSGFDKIKALCGQWEIRGAHSEHAMPGGTTSFRLTAGGSAVVETVFQGSEHEMTTVYFVDKDGLALTHYCILGNQPRMRAEPTTSPDTIVFKCRKADNAAIELDDHMHQATFKFIDPNHVKEEWVLYKDGKPEGAHAFEIVRKTK